MPEKQRCVPKVHQDTSSGTWDKIKAKITFFLKTER
jgi:hypothetical protein